MDVISDVISTSATTDRRATMTTTKTTLTTRRCIGSKRFGIEAARFRAPQEFVVGVTCVVGVIKV